MNARSDIDALRENAIEGRVKSAGRPIAIVLIALLVTGCASTKQVPREEFEAMSHKPLHTHRVTMADGTTYSVMRFSVTDSTFVIEELGKTDERYQQAELPIILPLGDVATLAARDARGEAWGFWVILGLLFIATTAGAGMGGFD